MYTKLRNKLDEYLTELEEFNSSHADLFIERVFPEDIITQIFNKFYSEHNEQHVQGISYLDTNERDGIDLGSVPADDKTFKVSQVEKHLENELDHFKKDLAVLLQDYELRVRSMYLRWSKLSASNTASLLDEKYMIDQSIATFKDAIEQYYIDKCSGTVTTSKLSLTFHTNKNTIPVASGIYFLCHKGEIVYIGHSIDVNRRVRTHELLPKYYCENDLECVISVLEITEAKALEPEIISIFKPEENKYSKS